MSGAVPRMDVVGKVGPLLHPRSGGERTGDITVALDPNLVPGVLSEGDDRYILVTFQVERLVGTGQQRGSWILGNEVTGLGIGEIGASRPKSGIEGSHDPVFGYKSAATVSRAL